MESTSICDTLFPRQRAKAGKALRSRWVTALIVAGVLVTALLPLHADESVTLAGEVEAVHQRYLAAFAHHDAAGIARLFTEDGIFVDPGGAATRGRRDIEALFAQGFDDPALALEAKADSIGALGDGAWDAGHGAQTRSDAGGTKRMPLHYLAVYARVRGTLRLRVLSVGAE